MKLNLLYCFLVDYLKQKSLKIYKDFDVKILKNSKSSKNNPKIEIIRKKLLKNKTFIYVNDLGAGSKVQKSSQRQISQIAKYSLSSAKKSRLLQAFVEFYGLQNILELGTSLGISTLYLYFSKNNPKVTTIEGSDEIAKIAQQNFIELNADIELIVSDFDTFLNKSIAETRKFDFVFFDGNHSKDATLRYFELSKQLIYERAILFFDDIRWSSGMNEAWKQITASDFNGFVLEFINYGVIFFDKNSTTKYKFKSLRKV